MHLQSCAAGLEGRATIAQGAALGRPGVERVSPERALACALSGLTFPSHRFTQGCHTAAFQACFEIERLQMHNPGGCGDSHLVGPSIRSDSL